MTMQTLPARPLSPRSTTSIGRREMEALGASWLEYISDRADVTQASYRVCLQAFHEWMLDTGVHEISRSDMLAYRKYLESPHPSRRTGKEITFSPETQKRYFRTLKMFCSWASSQHGYPDLMRDMLPPRSTSGKKTRFKRDYLNRSAALQILDSIDRSTEAGKRNYAMILVCLTCALRIIEIQRADIRDLVQDVDDPTLRRLNIQGKGHASKDDYKIIIPEVGAAIDEYLSTRASAEPWEPLFASCKTNAREGGQRLTEPSISRIIKNVLVNAGFDSSRITAHSLRHTSITLDRQAGATLEETRDHARHSSIAITEIYDHMMEGRAARDEARILEYIRAENTQTSQDEAVDLISRIPAEKQDAVLELLRALAE